MAIVLFTASAALSFGQDNATSPVEVWALASPDAQQDYADMCLDANGTPWIVYIAHDGTADQLKLAKKGADGIALIGSLSGRGLIHQPRIALDGKGALWAVWSQLNEEDVWNLRGRRIVDGKIDGETVTVSASEGNDIFCDAGSDRGGRVWVAWQSLRGTTGDIFAKYYDPASGKWSKEIQVTVTPGGDWEPRLAFARADEAAIVFDSSNDGPDGFDVKLATVGLDGGIDVVRLSNSTSYEARASIAAAADGKGYWVTWERGLDRWGGDRRGHDSNLGLNSRKEIDVAYVDAATKQVTLTSRVKPLLTELASGSGGAKYNPRQVGWIAVDVPQVFVDDLGTPYLLCRYARNNGVWHIALTRYDASKERWAKAIELPNSSFNQDRYCCGQSDGKGNLWLVWPSDLRTTKKPGVANVYLGRLDAGVKLALADKSFPLVEVTSAPRNDPARGTPERSRDDRYTWEQGGKKYGLYWGDFHRHTSFSNCRTIADGCIVEHFRYAYDAGKLDYMGTSDHTDIAKAYSPYEWWENQKTHDLFQVPGFFTTFYVYEREQRWPWGHRNVIFAQRGAPIVYINRNTYKQSPWAKDLPVKDGPAEISPQELWEMLRSSGRRVCVISHTGATGMGTDWDLYKAIDNKLENLVEIYQGARVSYEGIDTPQPTVGLQFGEKYNQGDHDPANQKTNFGKFSKGVYQNALADGHKLGVFASSDHLSTNVSFGGVYAESFDREGIMDAIDARRSIAATDKIFLQYTCNDKPLGSIFTTDATPELKIHVEGTAPIARVTIVRNETDYKTFTPSTDDKTFEQVFADPSPIAGENRYYVRVIQTDGNMAWASPVWVTYKK